jgi:hypothetical protein
MPQPQSTSPLAHIARAFGWNLGRVVPSRTEEEQLVAAGVTEPVAQRYAVWRRSLLLVATVATAVVFGLSLADTLADGFGEYTRFGEGLEIAWLASAAALPLAALYGVLRWKRPGAGSGALVAAWAFALLLPFVYALLPVGVIYRVQPITAASVAQPGTPAEPAAPAAKPPADEDEDADDPTAKAQAAVVAAATGTDPETIEKAIAMEEMLVELVLSGSGYLLLLPAVVSLIPGVVNGCLRVKTLVPAAQLPGWLMVTTAPAFLLFWLVILAVANHAAQSALLVFGVILWAGSPALYSAFGRVLVRPQLTDADAAKIGKVKKVVGLSALTGIALLLAFALTAKVAGLKVVGFDRAAAVTTKLDALAEDDETSLEDVEKALAQSKSVVYAFDMSSYRLVLDVLAKLLVVTAVASHLVLRATIAAWQNDRSLRGDGAAALDTAAGDLAAALGCDGSDPARGN